MADLIDVSTSALLAFKQAINTTGNNIANLNTPGYSRQKAELVSLPGQLKGAAYFGSGVELQQVERAYDRFLVSALRDQTAAQAELQSYHNMALRADALLADSDQGVDAAMSRFFSAWQNLANNPAGRAERTSLLGEAESVARRIQSLAGGLEGLASEINQRIELGVAEVNRLAGSVASLNRQIIVAGSGTSAVPNQLLDKRDAVLLELAKLVEVKVVPQGDSSVNLSVGRGQSLVVGENLSRLTTRPAEFRPDLIQVSYEGTSASISSMLGGGDLGGLLDVRDELIEQARTQLGQLAVSLSDMVNRQHQMGVSLDGSPGSRVFSTAPMVANAATGNNGSARIEATVEQIELIQPGALEFQFDGSAWRMLDRRDGTSSIVSFPLQVQGLQLQLSGTPSVGDRFELAPYASVASSMSLALRDPAGIAAAAPLVASLGSANLGSLQVEDVRVTNPAVLPLSAPVQVQFDSNALGSGAPGFLITGGITTTLAHDPAATTLSVAGIEIDIRGTAVQGDSFSVEASGVSGDNRNALGIASLIQQKILGAGDFNLTDLYGDMVSGVASRTRHSDINLQAETALLEQASQAQTSVSGVNLDEEAARLMQLQQAYQAAARMVSIADDLFNTLLNAVAR